MKLWPSPSQFDATPTPVMKSIRIDGYKRVPGFDFARHLKSIQMAALLGLKWSNLRGGCC